MISLLKIFNEVFDSKYPVKNREMTHPPKEGQLYDKKRISVFHAEGKKFIIEMYQYPNDFFLVSYYPKLNRDFKDNKYRIQLNLKNPYTVLSTVFSEMGKIFNDNPMASCGFYGAPDLEDNEPNFTIENSKRFKIYRQLIGRFNLNNGRKIIVDESNSSIILLSDEKLKVMPNLYDVVKEYMENAIE